MDGLRPCRCPVPQPHPKPGQQSTCVRCGFHICPEWTSSDQTIAKFFDRLELTFPGGPPPWFEAFRAQCEARERAGRETFGFSYLARDNPLEGTEEAADLAIYGYLDGLKAIRESLTDESDLALTAAWHAAQAHHMLLRLRQRRAGSP